MFDTVVIGGGPAGASVGAMLKKYAPEHEVLILERETFPRDHVGESLLPLVCVYLDEMRVWEKIEAAGFPIKIGATYRWGSTDDLWQFNFLPHGKFDDEARPAVYAGQRLQTAFQVDRAIYDDILLRHAEGLGCEVRQSTKVLEILSEGDKIAGLRLDDDSIVVARHYVDASGSSGVLRRAMHVDAEYPSNLRNIAIWDYWQNARWAEEIGVGGTRIQVLSLGYGWLWFIPLGPERTSVGLVVPADYYKDSGLRPAELYRRALDEEPRLARLMKQAVSENKLQTTNDWSYIANRLQGENWFLVGDACGFADPILSAGLTLSHASAREVAFSILEMDRRTYEEGWIKRGYEELHRRRIRQHIRFADYWYTANACFSDLKEFTREIARDAGLELDADAAFQWLGTGGFANDDLGQASIGVYSLGIVKQITQQFSGTRSEWQLNKFNELHFEMVGVKKESRPGYREGHVEEVRCLVKGDRVLPLTGPFKLAVEALQRERSLSAILRYIDGVLPDNPDKDAAYSACIVALEALLAEGWVKGKVDKRRPIGLGLSVERNTAAMQFQGAT